MRAARHGQRRSLCSQIMSNSGSFDVLVISMFYPCRCFIPVDVLSVDVLSVDVLSLSTFSLISSFDVLSVDVLSVDFLPWSQTERPTEYPTAAYYICMLL
jgi:hypothetical protein